MIIYPHSEEREKETETDRQRKGEREEIHWDEKKAHMNSTRRIS